MVIYTRKFLESIGLVHNPNMWMPSWMYCAVCEEYTHHYPMSRTSDCFGVCKQCNSYSGKYNPETK